MSHLTVGAKQRPSFAEDVRTILVLALAPAIGLGIGRFAYALILPDMRASLGWGYAEAGFLNTVNSAGYLAGAIAATRVIRRLEAFRTVLFGTMACAAGLLLSMLSGSLPLQSLARLVAGAGAALSFIAGGALTATVAQRQGERASFLLSLFYVGPGVGIILSGVITPLLLDRLGPGSWWVAWGALAALSAGLTSALFLARGNSAETSGAASPAPVQLAPAMPLLIGYFAFGAGYIAYMTFMIAWVRDAGGGPGFQGFFWTLIGFGAVASPWLWSSLIARLAGARAVAILIAITMGGAVLPLTSHAPYLLFASALVFGTAFFAVVAATTAFVRRNLPQPSWPSGIAVMTIAFGLGQTLGPVATGALTDLMGGLSAGLWASVGLLAIGAVSASLQQDLRS